MWTPNRFFYEEAEKVADYAPLVAGAAAAVAGAMSVRHFTKDTAQTDRILTALGAMTPAEHERRNRTRARTLGGVAAAAGGAAALGYDPIRRNLTRRAGKFTKTVVGPAVQDAEARAREASKVLAKDIGTEIEDRAERAGEAAGRGLGKGLRGGSILGRILFRGK